MAQPCLSNDIRSGLLSPECFIKSSVMNPLPKPSSEGSNGKAFRKSCSNINPQDLKSGRGYEYQSTYGLIYQNEPTRALCDLIAKSVERMLQLNRAFKPSIRDSCDPVRVASLHLLHIAVLIYTLSQTSIWTSTKCMTWRIKCIKPLLASEVCPKSCGAVGRI